MNIIVVGSVGVVIEVACKDPSGVDLDLSSASTRQIYLTKPDGTRLVKTAVFIAPNMLRYTTVAGDIDVAGRWLVQAHVAGSDYEHVSDNSFMNAIVL